MSALLAAATTDPGTNTMVGKIYEHLFSNSSSSTGTRLLLIAGAAVLMLVLVKIIRHISETLIYRAHEKKNRLSFVTERPKFITVTRLIVSGVIFVIYFLTVGLVLRELGVNLTAYLASASILGLAISFGSQGLVQDIVSGMTLISCDAMDVGDVVEIAGAAVVTGRVESIGLRYTTVVNFYHQRVMIPNRTIANVTRSPAGGIDAFADVQVPAGADRAKVIAAIGNITRGMREQFGAIILAEPVVGGLETAPGGGWNFVRVHFKIWPGQGALIETAFRQQVVSAMKAFDPNYADWQVPVTYRATSPTPGKK